MARENWTSSLGFILAAAGSAIGLGNIWKFPYLAGMHGGGTFVLVYLICIVAIGLPVMCAEMLVGRHTRRNVINAMGKIERIAPHPALRYVMATLSGCAAVAFTLNGAWLMTCVSLLGVWFFAFRGFAVLGWIAAAVALGILSYYAVIGGWIVEYIWRSATGALSFAGDIAAAERGAKAFFGDYIADPWRVLVGYLIFMGATAAMIFGGIRAGIERICKVLMPLLFLLLLVVIARGLTLPGAAEGVKFLVRPTSDAFTPEVMLMAMGQVFYSLSLGMAIAVTYGSYLGRDHNILKAAGWVAVLDTLLAVLAGFAIFPAVFAAGGNPAAGPGLIFGVLPAVFDAMWLGPVWATCFFVMLFIAAVTSSASLLECGATIFIERCRRGHKRGSRMMAVTVTFIICTALGLLSVFSTADWSHLPGFDRGAKLLMGALDKGNWLDTLDALASNWILPFSALGSVLIVGWCWTARRAAPELLASSEAPERYRCVLWFWSFLLRWVAPIAILVIFFNVAILG